MRSQVAPSLNPITSASSQLRSIDQIWVSLLLLVGFVLRLYHFGVESLWYDETVSVYLAQQPVAELIAHTARDIHPPAYYLLLYGWRILANPTVAHGLEFLYAWPGLFLSMLVLAMTYALAKRFFNVNAARWTLAVAILQPFQVWFAQEVRMYALGALCVLLTLWAVAPLLIEGEREKLDGNLPRKTIWVYAVFAILGLYTLYYFLFWLVVLNLCVVWLVWRQWRLLRTWLLVQAGVLLAYLPWLPTFLHQVTMPPVPGWRESWQSWLDVARAVSEGLASLLVAHTPPLEITWPWALCTIQLLMLFYVYTKYQGERKNAMWLVLAVGPLLLLVLVSLLGPPIYHVRYLATYAPIFAVVLGVLLASLRKLFSTAIYILVVVISSLSLQQMWTNPLYTADDHRSAVATLAQQWRPGDVILVNAGWVYTALSVYWPDELPSPSASRPPDIATMLRLKDVDANTAWSKTSPFVVRTGSIYGPVTLGWGLPESDFFAISPTETTAALQELAANHNRIWHYRLYDTVNDPDALIREWLNTHTTLEFSQPFPGNGYLLLEEYRTLTEIEPFEPTAIDIQFADAGVKLVSISHPSSVTAGEILYVSLTWQANEATQPASALAESLRLYDASGQILIQADTPVILDSGGKGSQMLALPIPANAIPGDYTLSIVLYAPETLEPFAATTSGGTSLPSPTPLDTVSIQ